MTYATGNPVSSYRGTMKELIQQIEADIQKRSTVGQPKTLDLLRGSDRNELSKENIKKFFSVIFRWMDCQSINKQELDLANCCMKDEDVDNFLKGLIETVKTSQQWELNFSDNWMKNKTPFLANTLKNDRLNNFGFLIINFSGNKILDNPMHLRKIFNLVQTHENLSITFSKDSKDSEDTQALKANIKDHSKKNFIQNDLKEKMKDLDLKITPIEHFSFSNAMSSGVSLNGFVEPYSDLMKTYADFEKYKNLLQAKKWQKIKYDFNNIKSRMSKIEPFLKQVDIQRERQQNHQQLNKGDQQTSRNRDKTRNGQMVSQFQTMSLGRRQQDRAR